MSPRRPPLPREPVETVVDGFTHGGEGVARIEGKAVFVGGTLPGETVVVRVVDDRKNWARAELLEVVTPSDDRVVPPCPYVPDCGGCDLQHVAPEAQRRLKRRVVREQLERLGGLSDPPVASCLPVGPDTRYRNHAQMHAADDGRLGYHRAGSHEVVPIDDCLVLTPPVQALRAAVGDHTGAADVALRAHGTGASAVVLQPGPDGLELPGEADAPFDLLLRQPDGSTVGLRGDGLLRERVGDLDLQFGADAFFQVNTAGAEALVAQVLDAAGDVDGALVWDLYAGVGLLSLPLALAGAQVTAVEGDQVAARDLAANAEAHGVTVRAEQGDVGGFVRRMATPGETYTAPDVVVLDPPRTGAGEDVCETLAALLPATIVYVACDPAALARDAKVLTAEGYTLQHAQPLDLFPMTHHVEVVATFTR